MPTNAEIAGWLDEAAITAEQCGTFGYVKFTERAAAVRAMPEPAELLAALEKIKTVVCGDKHPNWATPDATTSTRGWIADVCDAAIQKATP